MANVIVESYRYTVEPLYQWDLNQDLVIKGLSVPGVPEIHFTNATMDRALVRQSSVDKTGVITVKVPNSLLQKAYKITAYVCIDEGGEFKSLYEINIPVKARKKPDDYTFEDSDGEIYSFNALENMVANALDKLESDRKDTLAEVKSATDKAIEDLKEENKTFSEELKTQNETYKNELAQQYQPLKETVEKHISATGALQFVETGSVTQGEDNIDYAVIWSRQGNLMSLICSLTLPPNFFGTVAGLKNVLNKPDWFLLPNLPDGRLYTVPGGSYHKDILRLYPADNEQGYVLMGSMAPSRADETESSTVTFNMNYIVVDN